MVRAFVLCSLGTGEYLGLMEIVREKIESLPEVIRAYNIFGRYDVIAEVETKDLKELSRLVADKIRTIQGVVSTETFICYPME